MIGIGTESLQRISGEDSHVQAESLSGLAQSIAKLRSQVENFTSEVSTLSMRSSECLTELREKSSEFEKAAKAVFGPQVTDEGVIVHQGRPYDDKRHELYGSILWNSGFSLGKFCCFMDSKRSLKGKHVLELGSGTGIVGLTLANLGATVTCTDGEPQVVPLLQRNFKANGFCTSSVHLLKFGDPRTYLAQQSFDLIVAADVIYKGTDPSGISLMGTLEAHMNFRSTSEVWLAYEHRHDAPLGFFSLVVSRGLCLERLEDSRGNATAGALGQKSGIYDGSQFVVMRDREVPDAIRCATYSAWNTKNIQIFRIACSPSIRMAECVEVDNVTLQAMD